MHDTGEASGQDNTDGILKFKPQDSVCRPTEEFKLSHGQLNLFGQIYMSGEQVSQDEEMNEPEEALDPEVKEAIAKIKQPPSINETLLNAEAGELKNNPAVAPRMYNEGEDLRDDLKRD